MDGLASRMMPDVRERQSDPHFLTTIAASLSRCIDFGEDTVTSDGVSEPVKLTQSGTTHSCRTRTTRMDNRSWRYHIIGEVYGRRCLFSDMATERSAIVSIV